MLLVTGANGLNGRAVVSRLSARGVPVRALVRTLSKGADLATLAGVEVVEGDMARPETLVDALRGVDRAMLISSSDAAMFDVQASFIDAARAAVSGHVVKLSGHHAGGRLGLPIRPHARPGRAETRGLGHGLYPPAGRRVHAGVLSSGAVDRRPIRDPPAHGGCAHRLDRRGRYR